MTTPTASAPLSDITTAVLTLLEGTGRDVWDGAYGGSPTQPAYPYLLLLRIAGGSSDPLPDLDADPQTVTVPYQVTAVSNYRNQCEFTGRQFRDRIFDRELGGWKYSIAMPDGWFCTARLIDPVLPGVDQAGQQPTVTYSQPSRFYLTVARA